MYKNKYLKYKTKYLLLKNKYLKYLNGGNYILDRTISNNKFIFPYGIIQLTDGNIAISNSNNNQIIIFDIDGTQIALFDSTNEHIFNYPTGIIQLPNNNIAVTDTNNNRIYIFDIYGYVKLSINKISYNQKYINFNHPSGIALSNDRIFITNSGTNQIFILNYDFTCIAKFGSYGKLDGQFDNPTGICKIGNEYIAIVDTNNNRIQVFDTDGNFMYKFGSSANYYLNHPYGITQLFDHNIAICNTYNNCIHIVDIYGTFISTIKIELNQPMGIIQLTNNNIAVTDTNNHCVKIFTHEEDKEGEEEFTTYYNFVEKIDAPSNILSMAKISENEIIFCVKNKKSIHILDINSKNITEFNINIKLLQPVSVIKLLNGNIGICDMKSHCIQIFEDTGNHIQSIDTYVDTDEYTSKPCDIVHLSDNTIAITDFANDCVKVYNINGDYIRTFGPSGVLESPTKII